MKALHLQMRPLGLGLDPSPAKVTQMFLPFEAHRGEEVTVRKLWKSPDSTGNSSLCGRRVVVSMPALEGWGELHFKLAVILHGGPSEAGTRPMPFSCTDRDDCHCSFQGYVWN